MNNREGDINYWPCISDMFLVFFIMMMAIVITKGGYDTAGDKFVIDDVVRDYQALVAKVEKMTDKPERVADCYYLPKDQYDLMATDAESGAPMDPEPGLEGRPLLRQKMLRLLRVIDEQRLYRKGKAFEKSKRLSNGMPHFEQDGVLNVAEYPFGLPEDAISLHGVMLATQIASSYAEALTRLEPGETEIAGSEFSEYSYADALRLLAFRVLYEPESNLRGADNATLMRKLCMAFDTDDGLNIGEGVDLEAQLEALKKALQEKNRELARQQAENKRMDELLKKLCDITGVQRDADLPSFIARLLNQDGMEALQQEVRDLKKKIADLQAQLEKANRLAAMLGSSTLDEATLSKVVEYLKIGLNARPYATCLDGKDGWFSSGSAQFIANESGKTKIAELVRQLKMKAKGTNGSAAYEVVIVGFSDAAGSEESNTQLALERAVDIRSLILKQMNLDKEDQRNRLVYLFEGNYVKFNCYSGSSINPIRPNDPSDAQNRRIEVKIAPGSVDEIRAVYDAQQAADKAKENSQKDENKKTGATTKKPSGEGKPVRKKRNTSKMRVGDRWIEVDTTNPNVVDE